MLGGIGAQELILILLVILLLFGAKKIPELAQVLGLGMSEFRKDMKEKPVQQLGVFLKLMGIKWKKKSKKTEDGGKEYYYRIPQERIDELNDIVSRRNDSQIKENWHTQRNATTENRLFNDFHDVEYQIKEQIKNPDVHEDGEMVAGFPNGVWAPSQVTDEFTS